ncbi:hypothetical protein HORIV_46060 [Vreelandella olivaria]|uniref:Uncharacterized protein n=1 Tax=Vreelandella olivaria TaxID=390919 RepID=A0ABN5X0S5_9GAMM|nr:hypothetical protein HORIV_46060 [Halomonas olivaria]
MENLHTQVAALSMHGINHPLVFRQLRFINKRVGTLEHRALWIRRDTAGDNQANPALARSA